MVIIFNGPPGSGKDAACEYLSKTYDYTHMSFKDQLFKETFKFFGVSKGWFMKGYEDRSVKETPVPQLKVNGRKLSRRQAMIYVSEDFLKPKYGKSYFGDILASQINDVTKLYCISDGGFIEELQPIINKFGTDNITIVQLTRDGCSFSNDSRKYLNGNLVQSFVLETGTKIDSAYCIKLEDDIRTYRIHNNGSLEVFNETLSELHEKVLNDRQKNNKTPVRTENTS